MNIIPINIEDLINFESERLEFKASWSSDHGHVIDQVVKTACAFGNDFLEANGGYIVIGLGEKDGKPDLPPKGLDQDNVDEIQKKLFEKFRLITPDYIPIMQVKSLMDRTVLVIWCPAGELRPYQAPQYASRKGSNNSYYIRQGNVTTEATGVTLTELIQKTNKVPFDDRANPSLTIDVISPTLVRNYLADIGSELLSNQPIDRQVYRNLRISKPINGYDAPLNVALLLFVDDPEAFIRGARIEIAEFDDTNDKIKTQVLQGPIHHQIRQALSYLGGHNTTTIEKQSNVAQSKKTVAFPYDAMREALVNAVYHRSYENSDPILVKLFPDRMEIISYPGPLPGIKVKDFTPQASIVPQHRNRRIGEFMRQLKLAEMYGTGVPKIFRRMKENGSPQPIFDFDEERSYFRVILPAHPQYVISHTLRESAMLWATGERKKAIQNLKTSLERVPKSGAVIAQIIEYTFNLGSNNTTDAEKYFQEVSHDLEISDRHLVYIAMAKGFLDRQNIKRASEILSNSPHPANFDEEVAILYKRAGQFEEAHRIFNANYALFQDDPKAIHEFAQTKMKLASKTRNPDTRMKLNKETLALLRRVIQLTVGDNVRLSWCYFDLARVLCWLKSPESDILDAYHKAIELNPSEGRFSEYLNRYRQEHKC